MSKFLQVAFDSQEKQRKSNMRFEWMEFFLQNIVQYNPTGKNFCSINQSGGQGFPPYRKRYLLKNACQLQELIVLLL
jgi:hypothetical protein